jgi:hypothetical protein
LSDKVQAFLSGIEPLIEVVDPNTR